MKTPQEMAEIERTFSALTRQYQAYLDQHGLPHMSCDELLVEIAAWNLDLDPQVIGWLRNFEARWDAVTERALTT